MSRSALQVALPVLLVVLAGCGGFAADPFESQPDRDVYGVDEPLDPTELGTADDEFEDEPPWLDSSGDDHQLHHDQLYETSVELLEERAHTRVTGARISADDDVVLENAGVHHTGPDGTTYASEHLIDGPHAHLLEPPTGAHTDLDRAEQYHDAEVGFTRLEYANGSVAHERGTTQSVAYEPQLRTILMQTEDVTVTPLEGAGDDEEPRYHVAVSGEDAPMPFDSTEPFSLELHVTERGLVEYARLEGTIDTDEVTVREAFDDHDALTVEEQLYVVNVDDTTVEEPDWIDEAHEAIDHPSFADGPDWLPTGERTHVDRYELQDAHQSALGSTTWTKTSTATVTADGERYVDNQFTERYDPDADQTALEGAIDGEYPDLVGGAFDWMDENASAVETWATSRAGYQQTQYGNDTVSYGEWSPGWGGFGAGTLPQFGHPLQLAEDVQVVPYEDDGERYYELISNTPDRHSPFLEHEPFRVELHVTEDGVIERATLEGTVRVNETGIDPALVDDQETVTLEEELVTDVGDTEVAEPGWLEDAREAIDDDDVEYADVDDSGEGDEDNGNNSGEVAAD